MQDILRLHDYTMLNDNKYNCAEIKYTFSTHTDIY